MDWNTVPEPVKAELLEKLVASLGFTTERAKQFYEDSKREAATDGETDFRGDAIGKFKHFLRSRRRWPGLILDALWPAIEPLAAAVVDSVIEE